MTQAPKRIAQSAEILINASVDVVFPLFDPINEKKWATGWAPRVLYPVDETVGEHMIFTTKPRFVEEDDYQWIISKYMEADHRIVYLVSTRERIWSIDVSCFADDDRTLVRIEYQYTGLTMRGNELNSIALSSMYEQNLEDWKDAIHHYLAKNVMV